MSKFASLSDRPDVVNKLRSLRKSLEECGCPPTEDKKLDSNAKPKSKTDRRVNEQLKTIQRLAGSTGNTRLGFEAAEDLRRHTKRYEEIAFGIDALRTEAAQVLVKASSETRLIHQEEVDSALKKAQAAMRNVYSLLLDEALR